MVSNCFSISFISDADGEVDNTIQTFKNSLGYYFLEKKEIETNSISFGNINGKYTIIEGTTQIGTNCRLSVYILQNSEKTVFFVGSAVDDFDKYDEIFRKTVKSLKF